MLAATNQKKTAKKSGSRTNTGSSSKKNTTKKRTIKKNRTAKGNSKKEQMDRAMVREAIMLAVSAVTIVFLLCNFGLCGKFGTMLSALMFGLFGITAYIFPVLLFVGVLFWVSNIGSGKAKIKLIAAVVVYLAVCAVLQQISFPYEKDTSLIVCYTFSAEKHQGGGWVGALLGHLFVPFIGALGMHILMTAFILAGVVLITEKSFVGGVKKQGSRVIRAAAEDTQRRVKIRQNREVERQQQVKTEKSRKKTTAAAIFTLDESSILPEMEVTQTAEEKEYIEEMLYQQENLEPFTRIPEEKDPQDMTIYQNVIADMEIGVDIPPEMVPFPIAGRESSAFEKEQQRMAETVVENHVEKRNEFYIKESKGDSFRTEGWNILSTPSFNEPNREKSETFSKVQEDISKQKEPSIVLEEQEGSSYKEENDSSEEKNSSEEKHFILECEKPFESTKTEWEIEEQKSFSNRKEVSDIGLEITDNALELELVKKVEYKFPPLSLLKKGKHSLSDQKQKEENQIIAQKLESTLRSFGVGVTVTEVTSGPTVTRYELLPAQGVKVSRIVGLADDIKLSLAAADIRIEAPIPGKSAVGIEVPNKEIAMVMLKDLLESESFQQHPSRLAFAVGKDIEGQTIVTDIAKMPHALIAGATGSGKSVCINTLIISILYKAHPDDVKLIMIDPKVVELSIYNGIPHLLIPVVTDPKKAAGALNWAVAEMTDRYNKFSEWNVRNIQGYNEKIEMLKEEELEETIQKMPQIVIIIDELADLMMVASNEVEEAICRLAQLARAAGIHLIIATQRPSVNVITGLIKANVPSRIAFAVSSGVDSRTILDTVGAEKLLGRGDMLFAPYGASSPTRIQGAFVSDSEVTAVVEFLKGQEEFLTKSIVENQMMSAIASGIEGDGTGAGRDDYFVEAGRLILQNEKASIGMLQRKFKIGFNRAARIMDQLADAGVVGPEEGTKPRKIIMTLEEFEEIFRSLG